jgi:hypothetical protein
MKIIKDYEVYGYWATPSDKHKCSICGATLESVPKEGHFNSRYLGLKKNDGCELLCCPNGCSLD